MAIIPQDIPLLRDILQQQGGELDPPSRPPITLMMLAKELNVAGSRLVPLVEYGWLQRAEQFTDQTSGTAGSSLPPLTSSSLLRSPSPAAITWLRQFFLPPQAKPLFTVDDVQGLLAEAGVVMELEDVATLAADYQTPCQFDPGLGGKSGRGLLLSWQSTRKLLLEVLAGGRRQEWAQVRFDRQAMLWLLLGKSPAAATRAPEFDEQLEEEISRVAKLPEPQRSIRAAALLDQWEDAKAIAATTSLLNPGSTSAPPTTCHASSSSDDTFHKSAPAVLSGLESLERVFSVLRTHE